jgi:hypothetical protein
MEFEELSGSLRSKEMGTMSFKWMFALLLYGYSIQLQDLSHADQVNIVQFLCVQFPSCFGVIYSHFAGRGSGSGVD